MDVCPGSPSSQCMCWGYCSATTGCRTSTWARQAGNRSSSCSLSRILTCPVSVAPASPEWSRPAPWRHSSQTDASHGEMAEEEAECHWTCRRSRIEPGRDGSGSANSLEESFSAPGLLSSARAAALTETPLMCVALTPTGRVGLERCDLFLSSDQRGTDQIGGETNRSEGPRSFDEIVRTALSAIGIQSPRSRGWKTRRTSFSPTFTKCASFPRYKVRSVWRTSSEMPDFGRRYVVCCAMFARPRAVVTRSS